MVLNLLICMGALELLKLLQMLPVYCNNSINPTFVGRFLLVVELTA